MTLHHMADRLFQHLDQVLDRPACKTARGIVRQERVIYALRHDRAHNPLNIRIAPTPEEIATTNRGRIRSWLKSAALTLAVICSISALYGYCSKVFDRSIAREQTAASQPMTAASSARFLWGDTDYYPPEDER